MKIREKNTGLVYKKVIDYRAGQKRLAFEAKDKGGHRALAFCCFFCKHKLTSPFKSGSICSYESRVGGDCNTSNPIRFKVDSALYIVMKTKYKI